MKKTLSLIAVSAALMLAMAFAGYANDGTTTMYTTCQTVMYERPEYSSPATQIIPAGQSIICYQRQSGGFENCFYGQSAGWIPANCLSKVLNGNNGGGQNNNLNGNYMTTMHTSTSVNLRKGPGLKYDVINQLEPGDPIFVYTVTDGWAEVDFVNTHGYISTDFISELNVHPVPGPVVVPTGTTIINGQNYAAVYNFEDYMAFNPDVKAVYGNNPTAALQHFVTFGMNEGRQASRGWNLAEFKRNHPDYVDIFGNNNAVYYKIACGIPVIVK